MSLLAVEGCICLPSLFCPSTGGLPAVMSGEDPCSAPADCGARMQEPEQAHGQHREELWAVATSQYSTPVHAKYLHFARSSQMFSKDAYLIARSRVLQAQRFQFFVLRETSERIQHPFP